MPELYPNTHLEGQAQGGFTLGFKEGETVEQIKQGLANIGLTNTNVNSFIFEKNTVTPEVLKAFYRVAWHRDKISNLVQDERKKPKNAKLISWLYAPFIFKRFKGVGKRIKNIQIEDNIDNEMAGLLHRILQRASGEGIEGISLSLVHSRLTQETVEILFKDASSLGLSELYLSDTQLNEETLKCLLAKFKGCSLPLKKLRIQEDQLTDAMAAPLAEFLACDIRLVSLELRERRYHPTENWNIVYQHIADNKAIVHLKKDIHNGVLSLASHEQLSDALIRRVTKMLNAGIKIEKLNLGDHKLSSEQAAMLEKALLNNYQLRKIKQLDPELLAQRPVFKRLLGVNQRMAKFVAGVDAIYKNLLLKVLFTTVAIPIILQDFFAITPLTFLGSFFGSMIAWAGYQVWSERRLEKMNALKQDQWDENTLHQAKLGRQCQTSYDPRIWLNWNAWTPAAKLAYETKAEEQLLPPLDNAMEEPEADNRVRPRAGA